ncbi:S-adenosyl-l-methionine hydroxide adenosyltransferase family protein [Actinomadura sp. BRA 177]|uniref:SAM hydrolase/SAM-dependent halogenase family protein n=1 Tax=Actinomadura sp. BRA 177 TaxID=2745202 RepID=UPI0015955B56|nr:SAM-dependent chlorinase/fluorinase [Actinomadura sp. BRA 177]NVI87217.1 SAM-dependent chlorinase/fluorinase [Actinomadura sp. BRA 177]
MPETRPFVSLATDFGAAYTAICAGVVHTIAPAANVLVLSDEITPFDVREGAMLLRQALPYLPVGVHTGIVDPGVGTPRLPVAIETGRGDVLVGPDNGLLLPAAGKLGGVVRAHALENPAYRLPEVSTSFHGRDIFSPAAAHIANGVDVADLGAPVEPLALDVPPPMIADGTLTVPVLYTDRFGSLVLGAERDDLAAAFGDLAPGTRLDVTWETGTARLSFEETFGSVAPGEPLLWIDSSGWLGLAVNQGSATDALGLTGADTLTLRKTD